VTADRFLELFRHMGGDVYLTDAGDVVLDGPPLLLGVVRWRVDEIGTPALVEALQGELELAEARLRTRGIEPRCVGDGLAKLDASLQRVTGATA
jgi:hypothetical protein